MATPAWASSSAVGPATPRCRRPAPRRLPSARLWMGHAPAGRGHAQDRCRLDRTSSGISHEQRGLKHRPDGAIRMVRSPGPGPMLRMHATAYGPAPDGPAWQSARTLALGPALASGGLARRPYDPQTHVGTRRTHPETVPLTTVVSLMKARIRTIIEQWPATQIWPTAGPKFSANGPRTARTGAQKPVPPSADTGLASCRRPPRRRVRARSPEHRGRR
jgi:hypothetical protein